MVHRRPGLAGDSGDDGEHRLLGQLCLQLLLPRRRRARQLPDVQQPLPVDPVHDPAPRLQGAGRAAISAHRVVLVGEELLEHVEHALRRHRIGVGRDDGREVQGVVGHSGNRLAGQALEIGDERGHGGLVEPIARHQVAEPPALLVHSLADGPHQRLFGIGLAVRDIALHVRHVGVLYVPRARAEEIPADDRRDGALPFPGSEAAAAMARGAGCAQAVDATAAFALSVQRFSRGQDALAIDQLAGAWGGLRCQGARAAGRIGGGRRRWRLRGWPRLRDRLGLRARLRGLSLLSWRSGRRRLAAGAARQRYQQQREGGESADQPDQCAATRSRNSAASSSAEAKPSMRTQGRPGAARRKVTGV